MGISLLQALIESLSDLNINFQPVQKTFNETEEVLKLLKSVLDATDDSEIASDDSLQEAITGLADSVEKLRDVIEAFYPLMSKVYFVLQIESYTTKVQNYSLEILKLLKCSDLFLPDDPISTSIENCITKIKQVRDEETKIITQDQVEGCESDPKSLAKIADSLSLNSNQGLLIEAVALDKLKENAESQVENNDESEYIDKLISLVAQMHESFVTNKQNQSSNPVPIPSDFCCPLSLELMRDPVIVASGQTYERTFIHEWIENGLNVCPKTRQILSHNNLIPNYTVKALIANWCEVNKVKMPNTVNTTPSNNPVLPQRTPQLPESPNVETSSEDLELSRNEPPQTPTQQRTRIRNQSIWRRPSERFAQRLVSAPLTFEGRADLTLVQTQVRKLVEDMKSDNVELQRESTGELRLLAKHNMDNRIVIANCGAIELLVKLLYSSDKIVQENAVTTLLNLSINDNNKTAIGNAGAIDALIHALETGSPEARENAAATLFSLSVVEDNKIKIGRSRAIEPLVDLLGNGTARGKRDAATALFNLSIFHENKERVVDAGAVKYLVEMMDPAAGMVDKVVAVLSNLATIPKGRAAIGQEGGIVILVEVVELGSARGKEHAAAALLQLCTNNSRFCNLVLQEGAIPPLVALSQSGTPRAKEKAQALLSYFRNQRHGNGGRN
jgi:hypothetical protein